MYLSPAYDLSRVEERYLLSALLSGLRPDGVRIILRNHIWTWLHKYEKAGAAFHLYYSQDKIPAKTIRIMVINHGNLEKIDLDMLKVFEKLYNTIDKWGVEI